ncbi:MAG: CsbD family protein [Verrucomicrobiota bacterium JB023]|nr:CsbD family protein [Verrucomicrobiota bacterium JB023]
MNTDQAKGNWKILVGKLKEQYGETFNDLDAETEGDIEQVEGRLQRLKGTSREEAHRLINDLMS